MSKKEGVPGPNFIAFGSILGSFWGQKGLKSSSRKGSIFEAKNGREKVGQKSEKKMVQGAMAIIGGSYSVPKWLLGGRGEYNKLTKRSTARYLNTPLGQRPGELLLLF